jgi:C-terminal processing protease CtpA/Prc
VEELQMSSPMSGQVSFFSSDDESSLEKLGKSEIVELTAPPGVLGLVIDTVHGGIPTVFSVKEESVIADKVKEGDRLISVNGVDTTELSARNVSKVISRFKDSERTMIFFRQKPSNENMQ